MKYHRYIRILTALAILLGFEVMASSENVSTAPPPPPPAPGVPPAPGAPGAKSVQEIRAAREAARKAARAAEEEAQRNALPAGFVAVSEEYGSDHYHYNNTGNVQTAVLRPNERRGDGTDAQSFHLLSEIIADSGVSPIDVVIALDVDRNLREAGPDGMARMRHESIWGTLGALKASGVDIILITGARAESMNPNVVKDIITRFPSADRVTASEFWPTDKPGVGVIGKDYKGDDAKALYSGMIFSSMQKGFAIDYYCHTVRQTAPGLVIFVDDATHNVVDVMNYFSKTRSALRVFTVLHEPDPTTLVAGSNEGDDPKLPELVSIYSHQAAKYRLPDGNLKSRLEGFAAGH